MVLDVHSVAKPQEIAVTHMHLNMAVDFTARQIKGTVTYTLKHNDASADTLWLDTKALNVERATVNGAPVSYILHKEDAVMGRALAVLVGKEAKEVQITYTTTEGSDALQWLAPEQTAGKEHPFLFTQGEAILTRSWIPCQDSPGVRITYTAEVTVPTGFMAVMSAEGNPTATNATGKYSFKMSHPIAPYLIALGVGHLSFHAYDDKTGVYAEPSVLPACVKEFPKMPGMLKAAEALYGTYIWGRYDLLVLPPSFPFGGMENPCLTFATPTILAGDQSLVNLVAHELAHSWSGNTVTNATWNDFWLNEGFTVYFERRIMEALEGKDYADMLAVLGYMDLQHTVEDLGPTSAATHLRLSLKGQNPDDGMNDIAYEKGYFLLRHLENLAGREAWDKFLNAYFKRYSLKSITTDDFLKAVEEDLCPVLHKSLAELKLEDWIDKPGIPAALVAPTSKRFEAVDAVLASGNYTDPTTVALTKSWSTHEWLRFLNKVSKELTPATMAELDKVYGFTQSHNAEIQSVWYAAAAAKGYAPAAAPLETFLVHTGRRKFLLPIYKGILAGPGGKAEAQRIYAKARGNYHFVARNTLDELVGLAQ